MVDPDYVHRPLAYDNDYCARSDSRHGDLYTFRWNPSGTALPFSGLAMSRFTTIGS